MLDAENIAGTLKTFLLIVAALVVRRAAPSATGNLKPVDDGKLPSFLDER
jgi:hypothetical protein